MFVVSAELTDSFASLNWEEEQMFHVDDDMREPHFLSIGDRLWFSFFQAGTDPIAFQPNSIWRTERLGLGEWTPKETWGKTGEIVWAIVQDQGVTYAQSYEGEHYTIKGEMGFVDQFLNQTTDGINWVPAGRNTSTAAAVKYHGGVSETPFTFDLEGNFYGVMRNEDGDSSGWGGRVVY